jgi:hypothetical protein
MLLLRLRFQQLILVLLSQTLPSVLPVMTAHHRLLSIRYLLRLQLLLLPKPQPKRLLLFQPWPLPLVLQQPPQRREPRPVQPLVLPVLALPRVRAAVVQPAQVVAQELLRLAQLAHQQPLLAVRLEGLRVVLLVVRRTVRQLLAKVAKVKAAICKR